MFGNEHRIFYAPARSVVPYPRMAAHFHAHKWLGKLLDLGIVRQACERAGVSTIRKRRLPLESLVWCIIGMALFRKIAVAAYIVAVKCGYKGEAFPGW
ncbi:transposase domain-containing protein [Halomonas dongshanensis]|uniref:transposase domain-containing protein n=1 Tax=Halomonas dongshanensis TaxID=2890835 RepID=UPI003CFE9922